MSKCLWYPLFSETLKKLINNTTTWNTFSHIKVCFIHWTTWGTTSDLFTRIIQSWVPFNLLYFLRIKKIINKNMKRRVPWITNPALYYSTIWLTTTFYYVIKNLFILYFFHSKPCCYSVNILTLLPSIESSHMHYTMLTFKSSFYPTVVQRISSSTTAKMQKGN